MSRMTVSGAKPIAEMQATTRRPVPMVNAAALHRRIDVACPPLNRNQQAAGAAFSVKDFTHPPIE